MRPFHVPGTPYARVFLFFLFRVASSNLGAREEARGTALVVKTLGLTSSDFLVPVCASWTGHSAVTHSTL